MKVLYPVVYFVFVLIMHLLLPFNRKIRQGVFGRYSALLRLQKLSVSKETKSVWFHVASSGEFEQLLPILDLLKEMEPQIYVFVSFYSPSGERSVRLETNRRMKAGKRICWDYAEYSPFDFRFFVRFYLRKFNPQAFVAIHREIWPSLLLECYEKKIPCYLFSAYFPEKSRHSFWKYSPWLKYFKMIGTVDDKSVEFLRSQVPLAKVEHVGDSRIERVVARKKFQKELPPYASFFENQKVVVIGSVWPKDFEMLVPALKEHPDKRFIFVPHEPNEEFSNHMIESLKKQNRKARLWSRWLIDPDNTSELIYDRVGGLFELYAIAYAAFVGGSFVKRVHNVLEPAAYGLPILTGPLIDNSREAQELWERSGLFKCFNTDAFSQKLKELDDEGFYLGTKEHVSNFIHAGLGASQKYVQELGLV